MLLTQQIEVKITKTNLEYFRGKGYEAELKQVITINTLDLQPQSEKRIRYQCDKCGEIIEIGFASYIKKKKTEYSITGDFCEKCAKSVRAEWYKTNNPQKYKEINLHIYEQTRKAVKEKYGVDNIMQSDVGKEAVKQTMLERYGVDNAMKSEEIKMRYYQRLQGMNELETVISPNGKISYFYKKMPCSENQKHLWDLYGGELNCFIENKYSVDILLENKIYFEYDGTGHNLSINFGHITEKEMYLKEIRRYQFLKQRGYLQIVFKSLTKRNLPSDEVMTSILKYAQDYFSSNPNQHWIEFNYDNLQVRTKENTFPYDFINPIL